MDLQRNGHRAWGAAVALLLAGFLVVGAAPGRADAAEKVGRRLQMVSLTNAARTSHDRGALAFHAKISKYAKEHSRAMANKGYIFHSTEEQLRAALGNVDWSLGGENVGVGGSLDGLQRAFMASKLHRQNILNKTYDHVAVGIVRSDDSLWVTVIFYG